MLAITLTGLVDSPDVLGPVTDRLRDAAVAAGCAPNDVRVAIFWQGAGHPVRIEVTCATKGDGS